LKYELTLEGLSIKFWTNDQLKELLGLPDRSLIVELQTLQSIHDSAFLFSDREEELRSFAKLYNLTVPS
jgi:hypothetical protein